MKQLYYLAVLLFATMLAGCGTETPPTEIEDFRLNKRSITLTQGETYRLRVFFEPEAAEEIFGDKVTWESSKPKIASVDDNGNVKALKVGKCTISAFCKGFEASCEVEVEKSDDPYWDITLEISEEEIVAPKEGGTYNITVNSSEKWTATYSADWLTVSPTSGTGDNDDVTIVINKATDNFEANTTITFKNSKKSATLKVQREGKALPVFSVSDTQKIMFAKGNLIKDASGYRFTKKQYEYTESGVTDFAFTFDQPSVFSQGKQAEIGLDGWRFLTRKEMEYLFNKRNNYLDLFGYVVISGARNGIMILPDNFEYPDGISTQIKGGGLTYTYTLSEWEKMEAEGVIFLPMLPKFSENAAGYSSTTKEECIYWTSSPETYYGTGAYCITLTTHTDQEWVSILADHRAVENRNFMGGVRLVKDIE